MMLHNRVLYLISIAFVLMIAGGILRSLTKSIQQEKNNGVHQLSPETKNALACRAKKINHDEQFDEIIKTENALKACNPKEWANKPSFFEKNYKNLSNYGVKRFNSQQNSVEYSAL